MHTTRFGPFSFVVLGFFSIQMYFCVLPYLPTYPPPEQTNTCENITFPQLRWRVVKIEIG